jgi:hypothetical protein
MEISLVPVTEELAVRIAKVMNLMRGFVDLLVFGN